MVKIEISDETIEKVNAFKKLIDYILEDELTDISAYIEMILIPGIDRMFQDILPDNEEILLGTMARMFNKNPEFVCDFIIQTLKEGELILAEKEEETKKKRMMLWAVSI